MVSWDEWHTKYSRKRANYEGENTLTTVYRSCVHTFRKSNHGTASSEIEILAKFLETPFKSPTGVKDLKANIIENFFVSGVNNLFLVLVFWFFGFCNINFFSCQIQLFSHRLSSSSFLYFFFLAPSSFFLGMFFFLSLLFCINSFFTFLYKLFLPHLPWLGSREGFVGGNSKEA